VRDKDIIFVANARTRSLYQFFQALSLLTGPVLSGATVCTYVKC
jgi:hypothetical protein